MAFVFEPGTSSGDGVRGAFAGYLVEYAKTLKVVGRERSEGFEER